MIALFDLILSIIVLIVFFGIFVRLGQIRNILQVIAGDPSCKEAGRDLGQALTDYERYNPRWAKK